MPSNQSARIMKLAREAGVLRPRDLAVHDLPRSALSRMEKKGMLQKVGRGLYIIPESEDFTVHHSLAEACKRTPHGIVCLLSALVFHGLTTQAPHEIWMAIDFKSRLADPTRRGRG